MLLVEDELPIRMAFAECLRGRGFDAIEAAGAEQAIGMIRTYGRLDLVFTDVTVAGEMSGIDLAYWIHRYRPDLPVILACNGSDTMAGNVNATRVMTKPFDVELAARKIAQTIGGSRKIGGMAVVTQ